MIYKSIRFPMDSDAEINIEWDGYDHYILQCLNAQRKEVIAEEVSLEELRDLHAALGEFLGIPAKKRSRRP